MALQKVTGWETELFFFGPKGKGDAEANLALYEAMEAAGFMSHDSASRVVLHNGGEFYLDGTIPELAHVERGNPVLATKTMFGDRRRLSQVVRNMNQARADGAGPYELFACGTDYENPIGSQINYLVDAQLLLYRGPEVDLMMSSVSASRLPLVGAGRFRFDVGDKPGAVPFEIGHRVRPQSRDFENSAERLTGRLWRRFSDRTAETTMSQRSSIIAAGQGAAMLALMEDRIAVDDLMFRVPGDTKAGISEDIFLQGVWELASGRTMSVLEHQIEFYDRVDQYIDAGGDPFGDGDLQSVRDFQRMWSDAINELAGGVTLDATGGNFDWLRKLAIAEEHRRDIDASWNDSEFVRWADDMSLDFHDILGNHELQHGGQVWSNEVLDSETAMSPPESRGSGRFAALRALKSSPDLAVKQFYWDSIHAVNSRTREIYEIALPDPIGNTEERLMGEYWHGDPATFARALNRDTQLLKNPKAEWAANPLISEGAEARRAQLRLKASEALVVTTGLSEAFGSETVVRIGDITFPGFLETEQQGSFTYVAGCRREHEMLISALGERRRRGGLDLQVVTAGRQTILSCEGVDAAVTFIEISDKLWQSLNYRGKRTGEVQRLSREEMLADAAKAIQPRPIENSEHSLEF